MQFRKPPKTRVDAPIVFIHPADSAWDKEAIEKSAEEHGDDCPHLLYHLGETRYDASGIQGLLSGSPVEYHLRRLSAIELNEVQNLVERDYLQGAKRCRTAYLQAARYGLMAIKQGTSELRKLQSPGNLSADDLQTIADATEIGIDLILNIGQASYAASQPLRDDEKKL